MIPATIPTGVRRPCGRLGAALAATVLVAAGGCTFGTYEEPQAVDDAPENLFASLTTTPTTPPEDADAEFTLTLMFIDGNDNLVPVNRTQDTPPGPDEVLAGLHGEPSTEELAARGDNPISTRLFLESEVPRVVDTRQEAIIEPETGEEVTGVIIDIEVGPELRLAVVESAGQVTLMFAQIVCSLERLEGFQIDGVVLVDADGPIPAPTQTPNVESRPVTAADYRGCVTADDLAAATVVPTDDTGTGTTEGSG